MINLSDLNDNRYSRLELISWWNQEVLSRSRILVAGCGALGNEIIKNLAMLGTGNIFAVDMDNAEKSNLTRSVLFREEDEGKPKAETACRRAKEINPAVNFYYYNGDIFDLGLGIFRNVDVVICGLDSREARLFVNQSCWKTGVPMIDGAIEVLSGVARMFIPPDGACYECTLSELDYRLLNKRKSCLLLGIDEIEQGKVPTTPTISSFIASIQVQEAVKYLHNKYGSAEHSLLKGMGLVFNGMTNDVYTVHYPKREECLSHWTFDNIVKSESEFGNVTLGEAAAEAEKHIGKNDTAVLFNNEMVYGLENSAGEIFPYFANMNTLKHGDLFVDGKLMKVKSANSIRLSSGLWEKLSVMKLKEMKIPFNDILAFTNFDKSVYVEFGGMEVFRKT